MLSGLGFCGSSPSEGELVALSRLAPKIWSCFLQKREKNKTLVQVIIDTGPGQFDSLTRLSR